MYGRVGPTGEIYPKVPGKLAIAIDEGLLCSNPQQTIENLLTLHRRDAARSSNAFTRVSGPHLMRTRGVLQHVHNESC